MELLLIPPYTGSRWKLFTYISTTPYIWVAYRHKPLTGEIVMQMGVKPGRTTFQMGVLKIGFQYTFNTGGARTERWAADVSPGPITRKGEAYFCRGAISLEGPGTIDPPGTTELDSYRPTRVYVQGQSKANSTYRVTVYGHIEFGVDPNENAYAEIITAFPKIVDVSIEPRMASEEKPDPRLSALKQVKPVLRRVTQEEALRAGAEGFVGGTDDAPPRGRSRRRS